MLDVNARELLLMVECLFSGRRMVSDREAWQEARRHHLGRDGERAVRLLPDGVYTKDELIEALTDVLFEARPPSGPEQLQHGWSRTA